MMIHIKAEPTGSFHGSHMILQMLQGDHFDLYISLSFVSISAGPCMEPKSIGICWEKQKLFLTLG